MNNINSKKSKSRLALRILVGIGAPLMIILGAVTLSVIGKGPPCMTYQLTHIYCPGCGMGRACISLLKGDIFAAFGYNPLMISLAPFLFYYLLKIYIAFVFGKDILPFFKITPTMGIVLTVTIVLYGIMRNIPVFPFTLLAP